MLCLPLLTLGLATIGAYANPTTRAPGGLEVSLSTPADKVASVSELRVIATVKNVGDENLKILKLGTVLDNQHPGRSFVVTKGGKEVPFIGTEVSIPVDRFSEEDCVVIPAGKNVSAEHDVSAVYDFSTGPGTFTFDSASAFQVIGADDTVEVNPDINVDNTHPISITVSNDVSKRRLDLEKRVYTECKDTKQNDLLVLGYLGAKVLAKAAIQLIDSPGNGGQVYKNYFGSTTPSTIRDKFAAVLAVMNGAAPETGLSCSADIDKCKNLAISLAYTNLGKIYSCPDFFKITHTTELCKGASVNSYSDGGVILEQFTTIVVGTRLLLAGCPQITTLRDSDKLINSQNYQCFAAQAYQNAKCRV